MLDRKLYRLIAETLGESYIKDYTENFSSRIIVQKVLYLLTHGNKNPKVNLPYSWSFYLYGPYSSDIAHMVFHINDFWNELKSKPIELNKEEEETIKHFTKFKNELQSMKQRYKEFQLISDSELYELLATLTYISEQIGNNKISLFKKLESIKPDLKNKLPASIHDVVYSLLINYLYI